MGHWNDTKIGLKVNPEHEKLAKQFLQILGADTENVDFYEEIGELSDDYEPSIEGSIVDDPYNIMPSMEKLFSDYVDQFYGFDNDEDEEAYYEDLEEEESDEDTEEEEFEENISLSLDDLFLIANKLFPPAYLYFAHEDGNSVSDSFYRYEVIYDPSSGKKKEFDCYYSYGDGINLGFDDDPKEEATENSEEDIVKNELNCKIIRSMAKKAESVGDAELAKKLMSCI